jgi:hypothetical protein
MDLELPIQTSHHRQIDLEALHLPFQCHHQSHYHHHVRVRDQHVGSRSGLSQELRYQLRQFFGKVGWS